MIYDYCIVGGGIVGFATAMELLGLNKDAKILLLEKENEAAFHQTGHNSGVIHAGIYYAPGSLKAKLCREGLVATKDFCKANDIKYDECGKLIVATNDIEIERINALYDRATSNNLTLEKLSSADLREREPNINGIAAIFSPETAIVDYRVVTKKIASIVQASGVDIKYGMEVTQIKEEDKFVQIYSSGSLFQAYKLIVCGGLQADRLAKLAGLNIDFHIVPFRGEYYRLPASRNNIVNHLIYPAPDPELPFLGVHLTKMIDGGVMVGPNAVLGFSREGYEKLSFSLKDSLDYLIYSGFWKLIYKYKSHAVRELKSSFSKFSYIQECQKYCSSLKVEDLSHYHVGIRAQAVNDDGVPIHDFIFKETDRMLHVCNAPSPAATSAIPIGRMIAAKCMVK